MWTHFLSTHMAHALPFSPVVRRINEPIHAFVCFYSSLDEHTIKTQYKVCFPIYTVNLNCILKNFIFTIPPLGFYVLSTLFTSPVTLSTSLLQNIPSYFFFWYKLLANIVVLFNSPVTQSPSCLT